MQNVTLLGIDLAKNIFQLHGTDAQGHALLKKRLSRTKLADFIARQSKCTIVMEACGGANYWARKFQSFGHEVKLISPQFVKPFVKTNKNDRNDALAITEAASRPSMRFVGVKSVAQQDIQNLHRIRSRLVAQRTALGNQVRGLLNEYGICFPKTISAVRKNLPDVIEDATNELTMLTRDVLSDIYDELQLLDTNIDKYDKRLNSVIKEDERCQRLMTIPGVGEVSATAIVASVGDAKQFKHSRQLSAWLGLVPRQHSSGGKEKLLGISKRGDNYIRQLLIHGARCILRYVDSKTDAFSQHWSVKKKILGANKAAVALANRQARVIWALLTREENYKADYNVAA